MRLTRLGLLAERATRAFWPVWSLVLGALAALMLGAQDVAPAGLVQIATGAFALGVGGASVWGARRFRWPTRGEAQARLDSSLPGRPIAALQDIQAIGAADAASRVVWRAHQARMAAKLAGAQAPPPDLRVARLDPYALRYVALLAFLVALGFGSFARVASVADIGPGGRGLALAAGPSWEGWLEPPTYTGKPGLYLNDIDDRRIYAPEGSLVTLRLYGAVGALSVTESLSGPGSGEAGITDPEQSFEVTQGGRLTINGDDNASWVVVLIPDVKPQISLDGEPEVAASGEMRQPFSVLDDYGVVTGRARIALDLGAVDRRYGLAAEPDPRDAVELDLPITIAGDRGDFSEVLVDNFSQHPWAGLPVTLTLEATDTLGQTGISAPLSLALPGRRFFDPLARAVIEARRDLLWARANGQRAAQVLRAVTNRPEGFIASSSAYLMLRVAIGRLEQGVGDGMPSALQDELAAALWDIAVLLEDGNLSDALERMRRAQDRLSQAMRDGASDEEIAQLMQELREATQDYVNQLAQNRDADPDGPNQPQNQDLQRLTQEDLQQMMDRIQELMQQGRMAEAQELLDQLSQMMENLRVTEGGENGSQSAGEQAMEDLAETLRNQQGLSDEAFRDLQEQFNPGARAGQSSENEGLSGGEGRGESHEGQGGEGAGQDGRQAEGEGGEGQQGRAGDSLADRQQALRDELDRQQQGLPGAGTPEGDAARDALGRAGRAMEGAEEALRQGDMADALDNQADAMEALREGMRQLGEALAQNEENQGQQGQADGQAQQNARDPLGRTPGARGPAGTDEGLLQGEDVYRRARELLDELRARSSDKSRPLRELEYLKRLLDRF